MINLGTFMNMGPVLRVVMVSELTSGQSGQVGKMTSGQDGQGARNDQWSKWSIG